MAERPPLGIPCHRCREAFDDFVELLLKKERVAAKRGFEALLEEALRAGSLSRKSRWRDVRSSHQKDDPSL